MPIRPNIAWVSLWRSIIGGFGARVGAEIAKAGVEELKEDREAAAKAEAARKRKIAGAIVVVSALGLLVLSGAVTAILKWLIGAAFVAGLAGGGWYLVRNRWNALAAARAEKRTAALEAEAKEKAEASLEAQLAALKKKKLD